MKLLLDTNVFLEVMLGQKQAADAQRLLAQGQKHEMFLSEFSLHSIGCHLFRRGKMTEFKQFFQDVVVVGGIQIAALAEHQYDLVADAATRFRLDFDDAYQYAVAKSQGLSIVSFDTDFDRTDLARQTPVAALALPA
jgi:predicted nucleic acid-binding protein